VNCRPACHAPESPLGVPKAFGIGLNKPTTKNSSFITYFSEILFFIKKFPLRGMISLKPKKNKLNREIN
jgi:hypothetical protein